MALSIVHSASAAVANRLLVENDARVSRSIAQLSAGSRVLGARDDAAALAIGSRLRSEISALGQAAINAGQAVSMLQIAEGSAASMEKILVRMKTLAVQSASDQISDTERAMLDTEFQALAAEIERISQSTKFNGRSLLRGDTDTGVIYTIRSLPTKGAVTLDGTALGVGDSFTQADVDGRRILFLHDGQQTGEDQLILTVTDANGNALGAVLGEGGRSAFQTQEFLASTGLDNILASAAYARGATGAGIKVAVIDSGVDLDHADLDANINAFQSVDIVDGMVGAAADLGVVTFGGQALGNTGFGHATVVGGPNDGTQFLGTFGDFSFMDITQAQNLSFAGTADAATITLTTDDGSTFESAAPVNLGTGVGVATVVLSGATGNAVGKAVVLEIDAFAVTGAGAGAGGPVDIKAVFDRTTNPTTGTGDEDLATSDSGFGHGTHVAGIIAAERNGADIHGVAYEAEIVSIQVARPDGDPFGQIASNDIADAIDYARTIGAKVVNLSLGANTTTIDPDVADAISRAVNDGIVIVASAGNSSLFLPGSPANFAIKAEAKGMLIAVVATDDDNSIAGFSNQAGFVKDFTVAAAGGGVTSKSGTSMAAPMVSGSVALLMDLFPQLSGQEISNLLLTTTSDLGTAGIDDVFGRGLINLERATLPQLTLKLNIGGDDLLADAMTVLNNGSSVLDVGLLDLGKAYTGKLTIAEETLAYRVGTGVDGSDRIDVGIGALTAGSLGLLGIDIQTSDSAEAAGVVIDDAFDQVVEMRARFGASQNRLELAAANLVTMTENTENSRSEMMDLDVVAGIIQLASQQILIQANIGMLSQAQTQTQLIARLLS